MRVDGGFGFAAGGSSRLNELTLVRFVRLRLARFLEWGTPHAHAWRLGNERVERPLGVAGYYFVG